MGREGPGLQRHFQGPAAPCVRTAKLGAAQPQELMAEVGKAGAKVSRESQLFWPFALLSKLQNIFSITIQHGAIYNRNFSINCSLREKLVKPSDFSHQTEEKQPLGVRLRVSTNVYHFQDKKKKSPPPKNIYKEVQNYNIIKII